MANNETMKWDGQTRSQDVQLVLEYYLRHGAEEKVSELTKPKDLAEYLCQQFSNQGFSTSEWPFELWGTTRYVTMKYRNVQLNNNGARTLVLTWFQAAREMLRLWDALKESEESESMNVATMPIARLGLNVQAVQSVTDMGITTIGELSERILEVEERHPGIMPDVMVKLDAYQTAASAADPPDTIEQDTVVISADYNKAVALTQHIIAHAEAAAQSLYEVCKGLREMRDSELYRELGYERFEDYCKEKFGYQKSQAYKMAAIADSFGEELSTRMEKIGVTKLGLLVGVDDEIRQEVQDTVDLESVTVRELKAKIRSLEDDKKQAYTELNKTTNDLLQSQVREKRLRSEAEQSGQRVAELEAQVQELENRPIEVAMSVDEQERIQELEHALEMRHQQHMEDMDNATRELEEVKADYERKLAAATSGNQDLAAFDAYMDTLDDLMYSLDAAISDTESQAHKNAFVNRLNRKLQDWMNDFGRYFEEVTE